MQARTTVARSLFILLVSLLWVSFALSQDANVSQSAEQAGRRVEPVQPNAANPLVVSVPQTPAPAQAAQAAQNSPVAGSSDLIIGSGDLLEISVYGAPDFSKQVRVAETCDMSVGLIGSLHVA